MKPRQWMQIAAVASAVGLTGSAIAQDMDRTSSSSDNTSLNSAAQLGDDATNPAPGALPDNGTQQLERQHARQRCGGNDEGSTMASPRSDSAVNGPTGGARFGSGSDATSISGSDRLGNTNSDNFNTWMSDYASQHNGRITRQEFLDQMGNRWDTLDAQRQGLTPYEIQEIFVFTRVRTPSPRGPAPTCSPTTWAPATSAASNRTPRREARPDLAACGDALRRRRFRIRAPRAHARRPVLDACVRMGIIRSPSEELPIRVVRIGGHLLPNNLAVAPMAGVTDRPFRMLCKRMGAGYAVSEMVAANPKLWGTDKSRRRTDHAGEVAPIAVQIAGADPALMADAARYNVDRGAQIIDINMGCPAKKVCNAAAGSALLANEPLVARDPRRRRARRRRARHAEDSHRSRAARAQRAAIARIAEDAGIAALAVHGRTRACLFVGAVEYETVRAVKRAVRIPVFANGDIATPQRARDVLAHTGADGLMIGRAAQGRPWIFREIAHYLATGDDAAAARRSTRRAPRSSSTSTITTRSTARSSACASRASTCTGTRRACRARRRSAHAGQRRRIGRRRSGRRSSASSTRLRQHGERLPYCGDDVSERIGAGARRASPARSGRRRSRREEEHPAQRQQRDRPQRRAVARRIFPPARRRAAAWHLRHGDRARRARAAGVDARARRTATRRRRPRCSG